MALLLPARCHRHDLSVCLPICHFCDIMKRHPQQQEYELNENPLHDEAQPTPTLCKRSSAPSHVISKPITFGNMTMPAREGSRRTREMVNATRCMATLYLVGMGSDTDNGTGPVRRDSELRTGLEGTPMATNTKAARALGRSAQGPGGYGRPVATAEPSPPLTACTTRACGDIRPMVAMNETSRPLVAPREGIWGASELACIWGHLGILEIWKMLQVQGVLTSTSTYYTISNAHLMLDIDHQHSAELMAWLQNDETRRTRQQNPPRTRMTVNNKLRRRRETHLPNQQPPTAYTLDPSAYTFNIVQHPARASLDGSSALGLQCGVGFPCKLNN
ncbi:hypothetical protein BDZ97DRAFT_1915674 [Flammula alnicola]|nr:hypothetical protein BDZ97DRAFT_1915674 [Flammula alnicola]